MAEHKESARGARARPRGKSLKDAASELGMLPGSLSKHDKAGRVVRYADRSVDVDATRVRIEALRDPRGGRRDKPEPDAAEDADPAPVVDAVPLRVADLAERIRELAGLSDLERRKRLEVAKVLLTEQQAEGERLKVDAAKGTLVPASEASRIVEAGARLVQARFDAAVESGAVGLNARWAVPLVDARAYLRDWYRGPLNACADAAERGEL